MEQRIRHINFITEKETNYCIDVHSSNTINSLTKIIAAAANLNRRNMTLVHNEDEYAESGEKSLDDLFPNQTNITFTIRKAQPKSYKIDKQSITHVNIGPTCERHTIKYPNHYCFTCNTSICNQCKDEGLHFDHQITDKMDFLADSEVIVNDIFRDLSDPLTH